MIEIIKIKINIFIFTDSCSGSMYTSSPTLNKANIDLANIFKLGDDITNFIFFS